MPAGTDYNIRSDPASWPPQGPMQGIAGGGGAPFPMNPGAPYNQGGLDVSGYPSNQPQGTHMSMRICSVSVCLCMCNYASICIVLVTEVWWLVSYFTSSSLEPWPWPTYLIDWYWQIECHHMVGSPHCPLVWNIAKFTSNNWHLCCSGAFIFKFTTGCFSVWYQFTWTTAFIKCTSSTISARHATITSKCKFVINVHM